MGLLDSEYDRILKLLEREPTLTELGMFAVMWSEHCGYKYSRPVLAFFKRYKEALEGKGFENAGVVDIGDGLGITMKIESHNHPSAVEPYQGAATGVGGIIRDILTMGARPIASLNSLRFGTIRDGEEAPEITQRNRYLFEHVVAGIAGYGNCVGVPTVAGEIAFHHRYSGNPLINAMCVGVLPLANLTTAAASGVGNPVLYLGSATGKDGIHGATFASDALDENSEAKRPNVQIGDPFAEKLLIEATLEALETGAIVAIQDMGAAGLTCSTIEMASKGEVGVSIDLDKVPMRENDMSAYELMLSESQERMLAIAHRGRENEVIDIFRKWGLKAEVIGEVSEGGDTVVVRHGNQEAHVDARLLTDHCPTYALGAEVPEYFIEAGDFHLVGIPDITDGNGALLKLLAAPNIASKRWAWQQYDQSVITQTALTCGEGDAAVIWPRGTTRGIAMKVDGNARQVYLDPFVGAQLAVAEAARNVACTGARPVAITDGLNFGNPQRPHVYWQFREAVRGLAKAAETMETPVISGNVSFYNETSEGEVLPTPLVGMLGVLENAEKRVGIAPAADQGLLVLVAVKDVRITQDGLGASEYLAEICGIENGRPVAASMPGEKDLCEFLAKGVEQGWIRCAHDLSEGGLAVAFAELAIVSKANVFATIPNTVPMSERLDGKLFGEIPGRVLIGLKGPDDWKQLKLEMPESLEGYGVGAWSATDDPSLSITFEVHDRNHADETVGYLIAGPNRVNDSAPKAIALSVNQMREAYEGAIPAIMNE
jgi:phosphoribosylformylglycinamidine synthase